MVPVLMKSSGFHPWDASGVSRFRQKTEPKVSRWRRVIAVFSPLMSVQITEPGYSRRFGITTPTPFPARILANSSVTPSPLKRRNLRPMRPTMRPVSRNASEWEMSFFVAQRAVPKVWGVGRISSRYTVESNQNTAIGTNNKVTRIIHFKMSISIS